MRSRCCCVVLFVVIIIIVFAVQRLRGPLHGRRHGAWGQLLLLRLLLLCLVNVLLRRGQQHGLLRHQLASPPALPVRQILLVLLAVAGHLRCHGAQVRRMCLG